MKTANWLQGLEEKSSAEHIIDDLAPDDNMMRLWQELGFDTPK